MNADTPIAPGSLKALLQRAHQTAPLDQTSREVVRQAVDTSPEVLYALAGEALRLQGELASARHLIERLRRMHPPPAKEGPSTEDLKRQSQAWDALLGTGAHRRGAPEARTTPKGRSFEDIGARFLADHAGKVWLFLLTLSAVVVLIKERVV